MMWSIVLRMKYGELFLAHKFLEYHGQKNIRDICCQAVEKFFDVFLLYFIVC